MEFRLIVETPGNPVSVQSLDLNGSTWYLSEPLSVSIERDELQIPKFTCISYVWGTERSPNPFHPDQLMSSATLPSLSAAMQHSEHRAFWIDALCVPTAHAPRHATLGSMGYIYSLAAEVIITCPASLQPVLAAMQSSSPLAEEMLVELEQDVWITSVWTYQEVVNSGPLSFVAGAAKVGGSHFLNQLGLALIKHREARHLTEFDVAALPNLHALEDLLADWLTGGYAERSALRTMTQLKYRYSAHPKNYFYAAVGSIIKGPWAWNLDLSVEELSEEFMELCEGRDDYSFIYTANPRAKGDPKGRIWRPKPGFLDPILLWHSWGDDQRGHWDERGFCLENMLCLSPIAAGDLGRRPVLLRWLQSYPGVVGNTDEEFAEGALRFLRNMSYKGTGHYLWTEHGVFYLQTTAAEDAAVELYVAFGIRWAFGAPGLAKATKGTNVEYIPGVFVGDVYPLRDRTSDVLLLPDIQAL